MDFFNYDEVSSNLFLLDNSFDKFIEFIQNFVDSRMLLQPTIENIQKAASEMDIEYSTCMSSVLAFYKGLYDFLNTPPQYHFNPNTVNDVFKFKNTVDLETVGMKFKDNWADVHLTDASGNELPGGVITPDNNNQLVSNLVTQDCGSAVATLNESIKDIDIYVDLLKTIVVKMIELYGPDSYYYSSNAIKTILDNSTYIESNWETAKHDISLGIYVFDSFIDWTISTIAIIYKAAIGIKVDYAFIEKLYQSIYNYTPTVTD